ncbi:MAG: phosphoglycerate dehydrogenase [Propionicimonas sp.]
MPRYLDAFAARGIDVIQPEVDQQLGEEQLLEILGDVDGIIAGDDILSARVLAAAPRLRIISKWGVGTDAIDKAAAAERGITVTNTPGVFGDEVADVTMGYVLMLARGLHRIDRAVRDGRWLKVEGVTLAGRTLGVVGLGSIGLATARRGQGFGMRVLGFDPAPQSQDRARAAGVEVVDLPDLLAGSWAVCLNAPLNAGNHHMIDATALGLMRQGSVLVNTGRGPLVHEEALIEALEVGRLAGAALDVFEVEPLPPDSRLRALDSVILGSHNGSNTTEGVERTSARAVENLFAYFEE